MPYKKIISLVLLCILLNTSQVSANSDFEVLEDWSSTGQGREGAASIDQPAFIPVKDVANIGADEPVISVTINGEARTYPIRVLTWHIAVNDIVGGTPIVVTYCPYSASAAVYERRMNARRRDFSASGYLSKSNTVLYDKQSETAWQQYTGKAISGKYKGDSLKEVYSQLESFKLFSEREPKGSVLIPPNSFLHEYGKNPFPNYEASNLPFDYKEQTQEMIAPMTRIVAVGKEAWTYDLVKKSGTIEHKDFIITYAEGQNSALDSETISEGYDVGNILVLKKLPSRMTPEGEMELWEGVNHQTSFAFAFRAFVSGGKIYN